MQVIQKAIISMACSKRIGHLVGAVWVSIVLLGCTSFGVFDQELPKYKGEHIDALVAKLGMPSAEQIIMGKKAYIWSTSEQFMGFDTGISTSTGYVGTTPVTVTTYDPQFRSQELSCTIRVFVDDAGVIQNGDYSGSNGTCFTYSDRLKP